MSERLQLKGQGLPRTEEVMKANVGDRIIIAGHRVGEHERDAEILEVRGEDGGPPYVVRWDDGHVSLVQPGPDAIVQHFAGRASRE